MTKYKKYKCHGKIAGTCFLGELEARNVFDAKRKAWSLDGIHVGLCHQCSPKCEDAEVVEIEVFEVVR